MGNYKRIIVLGHKEGLENKINKQITLKNDLKNKLMKM